ncbi:MAG: oxygenase MpaB family protein [Chloroflexi bacterium]|nr:oxygenase MpaB family protein [Chloroflexota bacterium]
MDAKPGPSSLAAKEVRPRLHIPSAYVPGYDAARRVDPESADTYIRYTTIGDPVADAVVAHLAETVPPGKVHEVIAKALDRYPARPVDLPRSLLNLIDEARIVPDWYDPDLALKASKAFLRNSDVVIVALVAGAIVEGFSTTISKPFRIRGRIIENGVRRLKQNLLQLTEQFLPGGLEPGGDGWRLSLRIRLVHAQARALIQGSPEWNGPREGLPISTAHVLLGAAAFSGRLMEHAAKLGGDFTDEEREAYTHVWRYTGLTMGIPESLLFTDYASSLLTFRIATMCEPPPDDDGIIMANSIINSAPILIGVTGHAARRYKAAQLYQVSRELIGDELAEAFKYPAPTRFRRLPWVRLMRTAKSNTAWGILPALQARRSRRRFHDLLEVSNLSTHKLSYKLPSSLYEEDSHDW